MSGAGVYVYGAVRADAVPGLDLEGLGEEGGDVHTVPSGGVAALVSRLDDTEMVAAGALRAHWRVLEEVASAATVAPVRFGTVLADEEAVVDEFLEPEGQRLSALLGHLEGKVQLSVRCFYDEDRLLAGVVQDSPEVTRLREQLKGQPAAAGYYDRIRLGELVSAEVQSARSRDTEMVIERLEPFAVDVHSDPPSAEDMAVNAAFLVERTQVESFTAAVNDLTDEVGDRMRIRFVGPMPPYSFADAGAPEGS